VTYQGHLHRVHHKLRDDGQFDLIDVEAVLAAELGGDIREFGDDSDVAITMG
jgi:hypothetical protein